MEINHRLKGSAPLRRCRLEECHGACCLHGVWVDIDKIEQIYEHADAIADLLSIEYRDSERWFEDTTEPDPYTPGQSVRHSAVVDAPDHYGGTACIFWRPEDAKCALQVASKALGYHPWKLKPFYCILHPMDIDTEGNLTIDTMELLLDEPASCLRKAEDDIELETLFADEISYLFREYEGK